MQACFPENSQLPGPTCSPRLALPSSCALGSALPKASAFVWLRPGACQSANSRIQGRACPAEPLQLCRLPPLPNKGVPQKRPPPQGRVNACTQPDLLQGVQSWVA